MRTINIIGCGKLGRTLGSLFHHGGIFEVRAVMTRSDRTGREAVETIGAGIPVVSFADLPPADLHLVSVPDASIVSCCQQLSDSGVLRPGDIVFQCSGSIPSSALDSTAKRGAHTASLHPIKSFADVGKLTATFPGTFCGIEGDPVACQVLTDAFTLLGASVFPISSHQKTIYHAATVVVCNALVALMEVGIRCLEHCGLTRDRAMEVIRPTVHETLENVFDLGTVRALTGPISRGDDQIVAGEASALREWDSATAVVYCSLGAFELDLAKAQGVLCDEKLEALRAALGSPAMPIPAPWARSQQEIASE